MRLGAYWHQGNEPPLGWRYNREVTQEETNPELKGQVLASWPLFGEGGFFNVNKMKASFLKKEKEAAKLTKIHFQLESFINRTIQSILTLEKRFEMMKAKSSNADALLEASLEAYTNSTSRFPDLVFSFREFLSSKEDFQRTLHEHLRQKIVLAELAGVEEFPGESFEALVKEEEEVTE